ncbi:MAG: M23 family metallopeptidase [Spirochaetales bacterium]|nr:M23 family metallopeptidase [Spirochaetales bacterium]
MSPVHNYKKIENNLIGSVGRSLRTVTQAIINFFRRIHHTGKQRFTVMFIPHSEKKIFNFQISIYSLSFFLVLVVMIVVVIFFLSTQMTYSDVLMAKMVEQRTKDEIFKTDFREEMIDMNKEKENFKELVGDLLVLVDPEMAKSYLATGIGGNTPSYSEGNAIPESLRELNDLKSLLILLKNAERPLKTAIKGIKEQNKIFNDIPRRWPLAQSGFLSFSFGPQIHPIFGYWYIHRGLDIVAPRGVPLLATAAGKVMRVQYDPLGYGNYVAISHKYGFSTLYAHMDAIFVEKGQEIQPGDTLGTLGASGTVTGHHLHYEVRLGNQAVDPVLFLDLEGINKVGSNRGE